MVCYQKSVVVVVGVLLRRRVLGPFLSELPRLTPCNWSPGRDFW